MTSDPYFFSRKRFLLESENSQQAHNSNSVRKNAALADYKEGLEPREMLKQGDYMRM